MSGLRIWSRTRLELICSLATSEFLTWVTVLKLLYEQRRFIKILLWSESCAVSFLDTVIRHLSKIRFNIIFPCPTWCLHLETLNQHFLRFIMSCFPMLLQKSNFPMTSFLISSSSYCTGKEYRRWSACLCNFPLLFF